eukprot:4253343-Prymnesium_polylepis.1
MLRCLSVLSVSFPARRAARALSAERALCECRARGEAHMSEIMAGSPACEHRSATRRLSPMPTDA